MVPARAILIGFALTLAAGKAANIVAGLGLKPAAASVSVQQLLPPRATTRDGGFSPLLPPASARVAAGDSVGRCSSVVEQADKQAIAGCLGNTSEQPASVMSRVQVPSSADRLLSALIAVESGGDPHAVGDNGRAVGVLQIWPITVADANRILGREEFSLADRLDPERSRQIFWTITNHYSRGASDEVIARRWNAGPTGDRKACSVRYWNKVRKAMEETR